jgi:phage shock protein C
MGFGDNDDWDWGFDSINQDSIMLSTVRISMVKSNDSDYHVYRVRSSRGRNMQEATNTASTINFDVTQNDSTIFLPKGFFITKKSKFRNQRVWMVMEIPVGKKISFSKNISGYNWITVNYDRHRFNIDNFDDDDDYYHNDEFND